MRSKKSSPRAPRSSRSSAAAHGAVSSASTATPARHGSSKATDELIHARDLLHRAQCNDAYWHGIFGGLYAPHLRTELWRELVRAETIADALQHSAKAYQALTR